MGYRIENMDILYYFERNRLLSVMYYDEADLILLLYPCVFSKKYVCFFFSPPHSSRPRWAALLPSSRATSSRTLMSFWLSFWMAYMRTWTASERSPTFSSRMQMVGLIRWDQRFMNGLIKVKKEKKDLFYLFSYILLHFCVYLFFVFVFYARLWQRRRGRTTLREMTPLLWTSSTVFSSRLWCVLCARRSLWPLILSATWPCHCPWRRNGH